MVAEINRERHDALKVVWHCWIPMPTSPSVMLLARGLATELDRPRALLVISPHWETEMSTVGTASQLATIHDFGGFDPALYNLQHPASGSPQGARSLPLCATGLNLGHGPQDRCCPQVSSCPIFAGVARFFSELLETNCATSSIHPT